MCVTCGCTADGAVLHVQAGHPHDGHPHDGHAHDDHDHDHDDHDHGQPIAPPDSRTIALQVRVLAKNDGIAQRNRAWLARRGVFMLNLMSSPGAGKTTLLERTGSDLAAEIGIRVIEGDQETTLDARRIRAAGCEVVQINTGSGCHLDAEMVRRGLEALDPPAGSVVVIENVGNLVCPALFDLGEAARVVLGSVTEGADKPAKYPQMFRQADLVLVTKADLLPYVDFDLAGYGTDLARLSPAATLLTLSAVSGQGLADWYGWLRQQRLQRPRPGRD
jgi:hydrogenase nickel incorporation protein HypB